jgi:hypothetical protein
MADPTKSDGATVSEFPCKRTQFQPGNDGRRGLPKPPVGKRTARKLKKALAVAAAVIAPQPTFAGGPKAFLESIFRDPTLPLEARMAAANAILRVEPRTGDDADAPPLETTPLSALDLARRVAYVLQLGADERAAADADAIVSPDTVAQTAVEIRQLGVPDAANVNEAPSAAFGAEPAAAPVRNVPDDAAARLRHTERTHVARALEIGRQAAEAAEAAATPARWAMPFPEVRQTDPQGTLVERIEGKLGAALEIRTDGRNYRIVRCGDRMEMEHAGDLERARMRAAWLVASGHAAAPSRNHEHEG